MELGSLSPAIALAETCRVVAGEVPLWAYHRERLREGGCPEELVGEVERALASAISRDAAACGPAARTSRLRAHVEVASEGAVSVEIERRLSSLDVVNGPVLAPVLAAELPSRPGLPPRAAKPADRAWWDTAARIARTRGGHQALIVDGHGFVIDGSSATVWIVVDGVLVTPPAGPAITGVARRFVLERAALVGLEAVVRSVRADEIDSAEEVLLTNAFGGAVAVRDRGGPATEQVKGLFRGIWRI